MKKLLILLLVLQAILFGSQAYILSSWGSWQDEMAMQLKIKEGVRESFNTISKLINELSDPSSSIFNSNDPDREEVKLKAVYDELLNKLHGVDPHLLLPAKDAIFDPDLVEKIYLFSLEVIDLHKKELLSNALDRLNLIDQMVASSLDQVNQATRILTEDELKTVLTIQEQAAYWRNIMTALFVTLVLAQCGVVGIVFRQVKAQGGYIHDIEVDKPLRPLNQDNPSPILVIDDQESALTQSLTLIHEAGQNAFGTTSAKEALETFDKNDYKLIYIDLVMPEMSGFALANQIKKRSAAASKKVVIIGLSIRLSNEIEKAALLSGIERVILKNDTLDVWKETIEQYLLETVQPTPAAAVANFDVTQI